MMKVERKHFESGLLRQVLIDGTNHIGKLGTESAK